MQSQAQRQMPSAQAQGARSFQSSTQAAYPRQQDPAQTATKPIKSSQIKRKPVGSGPGSGSTLSTSSSSDSNGKVSETIQQGSRGSRMDRGISPSTTPGVDDSPYIRFALDQLTRDEDVRGSRRYPANSRWSSAPRAAVGAYSPTFGSRQASGESPTSPRIGYGIFPYSAATPAGVGTTRRPLSTTRSDDSHDDGYVTPEEDPRNLRREQSQPTQETTGFGRHHQRSSTLINNDVFVPFDQEVPSLRFLPGILRPIWLALYIFLCLWVIVGLLYSGIYSGTHLGLVRYISFGDSRYFVFQYLPLIIGMFLLLWLFQIQNAVQRIAPFIAMASYNSKSRSEAPLMEIQPTNFLFPKLFYFRAGQPIVGAAMFIFWLQIFTIPLFATVYNVYYFGSPTAGNWRWVTVQGIVWTLFALYLLLVVALITLGVWTWRQRTGLRWDPRSLSDIIAILDRSNIFDDYGGSETFASPADFYRRLALRSDRLGYWTTSSKPNEAFYGVGEEGGPTRMYSILGGQLHEKTPPQASRNALTTPEGLHIEEEDDYKRIMYRYLPWYLRTSAALVWVIAGVLLYLAFLIVSYVNNAVIHGFSPLLPVASNADGFSSTNFFYSFIPSLIAQLIFLSWLSVDYAFRRLQPYVAMSSAFRDNMGGSAEQTLLVDYAARLPLSVTIAAIMGGDFKVAWFSFLSLMAACLPIFAGGCFWAQFYIPMQQVRVAVNPSGYYALSVFLALFAFSLPLVLFGARKRRLPHACTTLAEQVSWLYASQLLGEREWRAPLASKAEMATRLLAPNTSRERQLEGGRFYFGRFVGKDGTTHIGIERIGREGNRVSMSQRTWRNDGSGLLTTAPLSEKAVYKPAQPLPAAQGGDSNITRSESGRFVPFAAGGAATGATAAAATGGGGGGRAVEVTTYYDDDTGKVYRTEKPLPQQPAPALLARPSHTQTSPYNERTGLLSESESASQQHARDSAGYPTVSSTYPSGHSRFASDTPTFVADRSSDDPFADPGLTLGATSRFNNPYNMTSAAAQDSMRDLAESDKAEHVRMREGGDMWHRSIGKSA